MGFYRQLSRHYDEVFAVNPDEMRFASVLLRGRRRLLDIGCGTGNKTVFLAEGKEEVVAIDLDAAMIEAARTAHARPNIEYMALDMLRLGETFSAGRFDAAVCLGNTLVHLTGDGEIENLLRQAAGVLDATGVFVTQILNYDRILDQNVAALPRIETEHVVFTRNYAWSKGEMHFLTGIEDKPTGEVLHNDIILRPLRKAELEAALAAAGFGPFEYYGDYRGAPYGPDSFHLIVRAAKTAP